MYPNFKSIPDREKKRQQLFSKLNKELDLDEIKRRAYAEAIWATDIEQNKINTQKKTNTQELRTEAIERMLMALEDKNANIDSSSSGNPPQNGSNGVFSSSSSLGVQPQATAPLRPSESTIESKPSDNSPNITRNLNDAFDEAADDIGNEEDSMSDIDDNIDTNEVYREKVVLILKENPELATAQINVFRKGKDNIDKNYFIGKNGVISRSAGFNGFMDNKTRADIDYRFENSTARSDIVKSIDWERTYNYLIDIMGKQGIKADRESYGMANEDFDAESPNVWEEEQAYYRIVDLFINKRKQMNQLQAEIGIRPVDKLGNAFKNFYLEFNPTRQTLVVKFVTSNKENPSIYKSISWVKTLENIIVRADHANIVLDQDLRSKRKQSLSPQTTPTDNRKTSKQTRLAVVTPDLTESSHESVTSQSIVEEIVSRSPFIEFKDNYVHPVYKTGQKLVVAKSIYLGSRDDIDQNDNPMRGSLEFYQTAKPDIVIDSKTRKHVLKKISWDDTLNALVDKLIAIRASASSMEVVNGINILLRDYGLSNEDQDFVRERRSLTRSYVKRFGEKEVGFGLLKSKGRLVGRADSSLLSEVSVTPARRGRGLVGAGRTTLNLNDIEGSGSASDFKYKRLGSKFIRVADLHQNKLKIVYPNRTQLGPIKTISEKLSKLINKLLFEKDIDQQMYNNLSIADKQLFHEILRLSHLQHQFSEPIQDPLEQLVAEFDKLKSHIMMGNDNPDLIREFKALAVDLYSNKLIDEVEFKKL